MIRDVIAHRIYVSQTIDISASEKNRAGDQFRSFLKRQFGADVSGGGYTDNPNDIMEAANSEAQYYQRAIVSVTFPYSREEERVSNPPLAGNDKNKPDFVSCMYSVDYQGHGPQDKFYLSSIFRTNFSAGAPSNNVISRWTSFIEGTYSVVGNGALPSWQCVGARSAALLAPKRRQMINNAINGGTRVRLDVVYNDNK